MIVILNSATKEVQAVEATAETFGDGYGADWQFVRALGTDENPHYLVFDEAAGAIVEDLTVLKAQLCRQIDAEAEQCRQRFITPGDGQAMEYAESARQAEAFQAGAPGPFVMLQSDVDVGTIDARTGEEVGSIAEAADLILAMRGGWEVPGGKIKTARLAAKKAVRAAATSNAARAAAIVDWNAVTTIGGQE